MAKQDESPAAVAQPTIGVAELVEALKALKGDDEDTLKKRAQYDAEANRQVLRPENQSHPGISEFNPAGERDHPKPPLACEVFWLNDPQDNEKITLEENRLFNILERKVFASGFTEVNAQGQPCKRFHCRKLDGSKLVVDVMGTRGDDKMLRLIILFPAGRDQKAGLPSMAQVLQQMTGEQAPEQAAMLNEIARLKEQLAASKGR